MQPKSRSQIPIDAMFWFTEIVSAGVADPSFDIFRVDVSAIFRATRGAAMGASFLRSP